MDKNKVYISPSLQEHNIGVGSYGTEEYRTNIIADYLCAVLRENEFDVRESHPTMTLAEVVADSNRWGAGIHVAIHTNAGGGKGTEVWHYDGAVAGGNLLAQAIYKHLAPVTPAPDRGVKANKTFYETRETRSAAALVEVAFHDNPEDAKFIMSNPLQIAVAIAEGICEFAGRNFKNPFDSIDNKASTDLEAAMAQKIQETYTVQKGDYLSGIAQRFGFSLEEVLEVNPQIKNPSLIYPGQVINLPVWTDPTEEVDDKIKLQQKIISLETELDKVRLQLQQKIAECNEKDADIKRAAGILNKYLLV